MISSKLSNNRKILNIIKSQSKQVDVTNEISYIVIYAFLYKFCSDMLKDYFLSVIEDKEITLDEAYRQEEYFETFRDDAFHMFGYFITSPDYFIDYVIDNKYLNQFFIHDFFESFSQNLEYPPDSNYEKYFEFLFDEIKKEINLNKFEFEAENYIVVKDIIYSISKLDVFEDELPFRKVFEKVIQSRLIEVDHDPDYINFIISSIVSSNKENPQDVYNPFMNDASVLINLYSDYDFSWKNTYAKSQDKITYCCSLVKLLMHYFDLDYVYSEFGSPFEPLQDGSKSFDVIMSRIPQITSRNLKKLNAVQNQEVLKRNRKNKLKNILSDEFNINTDSLASDVDLNDALESLISKMDLDIVADPQFSGEYESLEHSEYLFLINLINSLKDDGIMVVSLSQSFLVKNSLQKLRKYLTFEKNYIDAIISIPSELSRYSRQEIIVIFKRNKKTDDIVFIDLSKDFETEKAPYSVSAMFKRNLILNKATLNKVNDIYQKRQIIDKLSNVVDISQIAGNEFNLSISRYVDTFEGEFIKLEDLKNEKEEIDSNIKNLSEKIEKMMKDLEIKF